VRGPLPWILAAVGVIVVIIVAAAIGSRDDSGEVVPAGEWTQSVCGAVGVWRGELEDIVDDIRNPNAQTASGSEEPQSETPQGRTGFIRKGLERAVGAAETLVVGIDDAGIPDSPQGEEAAETVSDWADSAQEELEEAQDSLDEEADDLEDAIEQLAEAVGAIATTLASGAATIVEVARLDPELDAAFRDSSTCQQLRAERNQ
jgi:gas vesicle protein